MYAFQIRNRIRAGLSLISDNGTAKWVGNNDQWKEVHKYDSIGFMGLTFKQIWK